MKKVLSVLLAAAMVMGMSVSAFAANDKEVTFGGGDVATNSQKVDEITFANVIIDDKEGDYKTTKNSWEDVTNLESGDVLYFAVRDKDGKAIEAKADSNWKIKLKGDEYVKNATFFWDSKSEVYSDEKALYVKVVLEDDFDFYAEDEVNFYFYIKNTKNGDESQKAKVSYDFKNIGEKNLDEDDLDWVITVDKPTTYVYDKNAKGAYGVFDFDNGAYLEFKLYGGEKYTLSAEEKYNKELSKEYDTDVEVITFRLKNVENADLVLKSSKDNKQVVAVVDGELVPVEAEYIKGHKFESGKKADGYLVENAEYTQYAVIDADVEIEVEETKDTTKPSTDKTNPETGANDFVGAAVALAVVSVAAAGALAFKK